MGEDNKTEDNKTRTVEEILESIDARLKKNNHLLDENNGLLIHIRRGLGWVVVCTYVTALGTCMKAHSMENPAYRSLVSSQSNNISYEKAYYEEAKLYCE